MYSYVDYGHDANKKDLSRYDDIEDLDSFKKRYTPIQQWAIDKGLERKVEKPLFTNSNSIQGLLKLHKRMLSHKPLKKVTLNACCIPGGRRLFVTTKGEYQVCERVGQAPAIGNVNKGINVELIQQKYIDEYIDASINDCNNCWAIHQCGLCYANCYNSDGININAKRYHCISERYNIEGNLAQYHEILENNPKQLEILNTMELY